MESKEFFRNKCNFNSQQITQKSGNILETEGGTICGCMDEEETKKIHRPNAEVSETFDEDLIISLNRGQNFRETEVVIELCQGKFSG